MEKHSTRRIVVTVALLASLLAGGAFLVGSNVMAPVSSQASAGSLGAPPASQEATLESVALKVDGMWCGSCTYIVRQALMNTPGVLDAKVSGRAKTAVVTYDPTQADLETIVAATAKYGFPSQVLVQ